MHKLLTNFAKLSEALDLAHLIGVLHRDIKLANVLLVLCREPHLHDLVAEILDGGFMPDEEFSVMTFSGESMGSLP